MENKIVKFADVKRWSNKQSVKKAVLKCLEQGQISGGKICADLERKVLKKFDYNFFSTTSSGTASLHLALLSINIDRNHYVAVPDLTFVSTASSVLMVGAKPLLIDVEKDGNINLTSLEMACKEFEVKVVVAVHLYGNPCNLIELQRLSKKYNFII